MLRFVSRTLCFVALVSVASMADAQILRIGPFGGVRVRAPFVSVDVLPYGGGTRVRAPFTAVDTGAYGDRYPGYRVPEYRGVPGYRPSPAYPPAYQLPAYPRGGYVYPQPDDRQAARAATPTSVRSSLLAAAQQLKQSLSARRDDADVWLNYLQPDRIIDAIQRGESGESLRSLLRHYDGVANGGLTSISSERGFAETRRWLGAFVQQRPEVSSAGELAPADEGGTAPVTPPEAEVDLPPPPKVGDKAGSKSEEIPLPQIPTPL